MTPSLPPVALTYSLIFLLPSHLPRTSFALAGALGCSSGLACVSGSAMVVQMENGWFFGWIPRPWCFPTLGSCSSSQHGTRGLLRHLRRALIGPFLPTRLVSPLSIGLWGVLSLSGVFIGRGRSLYWVRFGFWEIRIFSNFSIEKIIVLDSVCRIS